MPVALELHDAESIALAGRGSDRSPAVRLPAVVRLDGDQLRVGEAAVESARYLPRQVHDRFYESLDAEPLGRPFPADWRAADLAHAHLGELWRRVRGEWDDSEIGGVLLAVGGVDEARLPLLLGIVHSLEIPLTGVVDSALAAAVDHRRGAADGAIEDTAVHLELYRHRAVASRLRCGRSGRVAVEDRTIASDVSATALLRAQVSAAAGAFVRATRFDPLARAADEQQLYDRLPGWLAALGRTPRVDARLDGPDRDDGTSTVSIELARGEMADAAAPVAERLLELAGGCEQVLLGARAAALGVAPRLEAAGRRVVRLDEAAACRGALAASSAIRAAGPGVLVVRLDGAGSP